MTPTAAGESGRPEHLGREWERVGVEPDVATAPGDALAAALEHARAAARAGEIDLRGFAGRYGGAGLPFEGTVTL